MGVAESWEKKPENRENTASVLHFNCNIWQNACHFGSGDMNCCTAAVKDRKNNHHVTVWKHFIKSTVKPFFHQIQKSQVFNRILGTSLSNSAKFQAPDHIYMFI